MNVYIKRIVKPVLARSIPRRCVIWRGSRHSGGVALTFDDGPDPDYTLPVLEILRRSGARATFFLVGERIRRFPEICRQIRAEGHAIGNHTYTHKTLRELSRKELEAEVAKTQGAIYDTTGENTTLFRPPRGIIKLSSLAYLIRNRLTVALWSIDPADYEATGPDSILEQTRNVSAGDVILLHDSRQAALEALPGLIERIQERNLRCVGLPELIGSK